VDVVDDDRPVPLLGGPLPLELVNTSYVERGRPRDGLRTPAHLADWLRRIRARLDMPLTDDDLTTIDDAQLEAARDLRECIRALAMATMNEITPEPSTVDRLNRHAAAGVQWRELRWDDDEPHLQICSRAPMVTVALSEIAQEAVTFFASSRRRDIRQCGAPACVLLFVKDHPRRAWCSIACGNRVRAARHYERTKSSRSDEQEPDHLH
jgi:predicted RNA-binding Zn ribbon-like protein